AIKIGGTRRGVFFTGLFGGLASSTAVTLQFSRTSRYQTDMAPILATGVLLACGTMFPRMLLVASVMNFELFKPLLGPVLIMSLLTYLPALWYWRSQTLSSTASVSPIKNPLELTTALVFGALLGLIMLLGKALQNWLGEAGVLALAATSGLADADAITLSLARMSLDDLSSRTAVTGIVIAAAVNSMTKGSMAAIIGEGAMGLRVGLPLFFSAACGLAAAWFWVW
ncbi:MAG: MgtC/SapB family protein, partial [Gammaproteobacteria bacterium]